MTKITWLTDIHLDCVNEEAARAFLETVRQQNADCVFITGDISISTDLTRHLRMIDEIVGRPTYFVLGNHDYWYSTIDHIADQLPRKLNEMSFMKWMNTSGVVKLSDTTCVIGHDGWYDCRNGQADPPAFMMVDWRTMGDFADCKSMKAVSAKCAAIAQRGWNHLEKAITAAVAQHFRKIVILTHVPPFKEAHFHEGRPGSDLANPFFTSKCLGDLLKAAAEKFPDRQFEVFAGHSHGKCDVQIAPNLLVHVGGAEYSKPIIQAVTSV